MDNLKGCELEYTGLRSEIVGLESLKDQLTATVFSISITLIGLAFTLDRYILLFILSIIVIPFQSLINKKTFMIARTGVYIKVFIEPRLQGMRWESVIHEVDNEFSKRHLRLDRWQITKYIYKYGTAFFSGISFISYAMETVSEAGGIVIASVLDLIVLTLMLLCFAVDFYLCNRGSDFDKIYSLYEELMTPQEGVIRDNE